MSLRAQQSAKMPGADDAVAQQVFKGQQAQPAAQDGQEQAGQEMAQRREPLVQGTKESLKRAYSDKIERQLAEEATAAGVQTGPVSGEMMPKLARPRP